MKARVIQFAIITACLALPISLRAELQFSAGLQIRSPADFYQPLGSYGSWVEVPSYGQCWHPNVALGWRPYCNGYWEWTDCGWYWVSDDPWAWACYHYGSWVYEPYYGWVWVPGTEWAPAWVTWRYTDDYIGWAPCEPGGVVFAPSFFVFVPTRRFHEHIRPNDVVVNNAAIINRSRLVNNFRRETRSFNGTRETVVVNPGPGLDPIQRVTGRRLTPLPITQVVSQTPVPSTIRRTAAAGVERTRTFTPRATGTSQPRVYAPQTQERTVTQPPVRAAQPNQQTVPVPSQPTVPQSPAARELTPHPRTPTPPRWQPPPAQVRPPPVRPVQPPAAPAREQVRPPPVPELQPPAQVAPPPERRAPPPPPPASERERGPRRDRDQP